MNLQNLLKRFSSFRVANTGLIEVKPEERDARDFEYDPEATEILGFAKKVIFPGRDASRFCPAGELQRRNDRDKMSCVSFSAANAIETLLNYFISLVKEDKADEEVKEIIKIFTYFGIIKDGQVNCSDRYIAKLSGTTERGNTQANVFNAIRKYGLVAEEEWPYVSDWSEYFKPILTVVIAKGKKLAEFIDVSYEWVNPFNFYDAMQYGVIQTSGYAWNGVKNGVYVATDYPKNHAFELSGAVASTKFTAFDSYEENPNDFHKDLAWDFNFGYGMIFYLNLKKKLTEFNETAIGELREKGVRFVFRPEARGEGYRVEEFSLTHLTKEELESEMKSVFQRDLNTDLIELTKQGKIKWLNEADYQKLLT